LIGSQREAIVIDASLPSELYLDLAQKHEWTIRYVLDTHIHADHLSRSRMLAERSAATLCLPAQNRVSFDFSALQAGQTLRFGSSMLQALTTPGHTKESMCYYIDEEALFTGDTLFVGGVGRPDLHAGEEETRQRARLLYRSIQNLTALPASTLVFPGHTSEPIAFDSKPICTNMRNLVSQLNAHYHSEEEFAERIVRAIPPTPPNYERITALNESGLTPEQDATELEAGANRCAIPQ
jgi:glyoxylase-like metal-dependent hydrolase (beta-lactamase superfamily II)